MNLHRRVEDFAAALAIFDFSATEANAVPHWKYVAGRDGAMTIYHFGTTLEGISTSLGQCRTLGQSVDHSALRKAAARFRKRFPDMGRIRDGVAHTANKQKTPGLFDEHAVNGTATITNAFDGRVFTLTWIGKVFSYELSESALDALREIRTAAWNSFRPNEP